MPRNLLWRNLLLTGACLGAGSCSLLLRADAPPPAAAAPAAVPPLTVRVDVLPGRFRVSELGDAYIPVILHIINTSSVSQSFPIMSCSWSDEWQFSSAPVSFPTVACAANTPITITLAPGEDHAEKTFLNFNLYDDHGKMHVPQSGKYILKAGFTPANGAFLRREMKSMQTYWSKPVTVQLFK